MKKRIIKKLTRKAVKELQQMEYTRPLSSKKIQKATFKFLKSVEDRLNPPKVYRDFWDAFDNVKSPIDWRDAE